MSSHRLSVSGQRQQTITDDDSFRAAQYNAKEGDQANVSLGSFSEISMILPWFDEETDSGARLEVFESDKGSKYLVLRVKGPLYNAFVDLPSASLKRSTTNLHIVGKSQHLGGMPHTSVDVRKANDLDVVNGLGVGEPIEVIKLVAPPTPE